MHIITIDLDRCNGCKRCYEACYNDVIRRDAEESHPVAKYPEECATCNCCELACPEAAITVIPVNPVRIPEPYPASIYPKGYGTFVPFERLLAGQR